VKWYGGRRRQIETVTGTGHWYRQGHGLVYVRWVYVHDISGMFEQDDLLRGIIRSQSGEIVLGALSH